MSGKGDGSKSPPRLQIREDGESSEEKKSVPQSITYPIWAMKMRVALQAQRVWDAVQTATTDYQMDREALYTTYQAVQDSVISSFIGKDTAKEA